MMSKKKTYSAYYWIMALACIIPLAVLLVLPNGLARDGIFFVLLSFSPIGFTAGVLLINWKKGKGPTPCKGEQ